MTLPNNEYGLTLAGLKPRSFEVIVAEIQEEVIAKLGAVDLGPKSVFSMLINIFAEREALLWELAQSTYSAMYPDTAEGVSLDNVCAINGLNRSIATHSHVLAQVMAINYTIIPKDSEIRIQNTTHSLTLAEDVTVNNNACITVLIQVQDISLPSYMITVNGINYEYTTQLNDSALIIATKLKELLVINNGLKIKTPADEGIIAIKSIDVNTSFTCVISQGLQIINCVNSVYFIAKESGAIAIPTGSANIIETPVVGWLSVNNATAGVTGRNLETDIELRSRRKVSLRLAGSGTIEAMRARLLNINNVTYAEIIDNKTNITVDDLPPKSFKATVVGGTDLEIGQIIWRTQPVGIESIGNTIVVVKDSSGKDQAVKFSRPIAISIYINIILNTNDQFIDASVNTIEQAIIQRVRNLKLGKALILQSLYSDIYSVAGITNATITMGKNSSSLTANDITVSASEILTSEPSNIVISKV